MVSGSLPDVLLIQLKRLYFDRFFREKIGTLIEFPTRKLNMAEFIFSKENREASLYDLVGVCNHFGGLGGGHCKQF